MDAGDAIRVTRRRFGELVGRALGLAALGLSGILGWRYARWSAPGPGEVLFEPLEAGRDVAIRQAGRVILIEDPAAGARALSARCSHLGCTVAPAEGGGELVCPCHGSRYDLAGAVLQGPAREPLAVLETEPLDDGGLRVFLD